ncbi:MAG: hypothetical protein ABL973_11240 [Micropepsaceae bacterium]
MSALGAFVLQAVGELVLQEALKRAASGTGRISQVYNHVVHGEFKTLVIGPGGTGKSALGAMLTGQCKWGECTQVYEPDFDSHESNVEELWFRKVTVAPGQVAVENWKNSINEISEARRALIIYTSSFGYHSVLPQSKWQDEAKISGLNHDSLERFRGEFLAQRRQLEIEQFSQFVQLWPKKARAKLYLVIAPTKADLWWDQRVDILPWYHDKFGKALGVLGNHFPKGGFRKMIHPICLIKTSVVDRAEVEVFPSTFAFDQKEAAQEYKQFRKVLTGILGLPRW